MPFNIDSDELSPWEQEQREAQRVKVLNGEVRAMMMDFMGERFEQEQMKRAVLLHAGGEWANRVRSVVLGRSGEVEVLLKEALNAEHDQLEKVMESIMKRVQNSGEKHGTMEWKSVLSRKCAIEWQVIRSKILFTVFQNGTEVDQISKSLVKRY